MSDVDPASIDELRSRFRGEIVDSSDPGYDEARAVWNATVDKRPGVIARCADTEDVVASVAFARRSGLEIAVRGGGHSVSGHSSTEGGIVIDLRRMRSVTVDPDAGPRPSEADPSSGTSMPRRNGSASARPAGW